MPVETIQNLPLIACRGCFCQARSRAILYNFIGGISRLRHAAVPDRPRASPPSLTAHRAGWPIFITSRSNARAYMRGGIRVNPRKFSRFSNDRALHAPNISCCAVIVRTARNGAGCEANRPQLSPEPLSIRCRLACTRLFIPICLRAMRSATIVRIFSPSCVSS